LKAQRPIYIIWNLQPSNVIFGHEQAFRSGKKSAVSMMQDWIVREVDSGTYEVIDTIPNFLGSGVDNQILVLKKTEVR